MTKTLLLLFLLSGLANFACSIAILRTLKQAGFKVGFYEMRWQVHKHLKTYRELSPQKSGRIDLPFYGYWGSLLALVACGGLLLLSLPR